MMIDNKMLSYTQFKQISALGEQASTEEKIQARNIAMVISSGSTKFCNQRSIELSYGLNQFFKKDDLKDLFNAVKRCGCCARHNSKKPIAIDSNELTPMFIYTQSTCRCACRHSARIFKRGYDYVPTVVVSDDETISDISDSDNDTVPANSESEDEI